MGDHNICVMLSVSGLWTVPIKTLQKKWEVRKTKPRLRPPFRVYLYETESPYTLCGLTLHGQGFVVGEFVCDRILTVKRTDSGFSVPDGTCLTDIQLLDYANGADTLYLWHISQVVRDHRLRSFRSFQNLNDTDLCRPPQSWCYVREWREDG